MVTNRSFMVRCAALLSLQTLALGASENTPEENGASTEISAPAPTVEVKAEVKASEGFFSTVWELTKGFFYYVSLIGGFVVWASFILGLFTDITLLYSLGIG